MCFFRALAAKCESREELRGARAHRGRLFALFRFTARVCDQCERHRHAPGRLDRRARALPRLVEADVRERRERDRADARLDLGDGELWTWL